MQKRVSIPTYVKTLAILPFTMSAIAQDVSDAVSPDTDSETTGIEVINVVAQKRVTPLQETPVAISAFSSDMLKEQGIEDALDIQFAIPNAMISSNSNYNIRGVGNNAISSSSDPGTGVHINGVYMTSNNIQNEFYDLQSIEVLRGPQGTLYGRNTTAGVVNAITARPDDVFEAKLTTEFASFNSLRTTGYINTPISDSVSHRLAFNTVKRDGYTKNIAENVDFDELDGRDQWSVRSSTAIEFSDNASGFLFAQYFKEHSNRTDQVGVFCEPDAELGCNPNSISNAYPNSNFTDGSLAAVLGLGATRRDDFYNTNLDGSPRTNPSDPREVRLDHEPSVDSEELLISFEFNYEFDDHIFTSVTAYHDRSYETTEDFDNADGADAFRFPVSYQLTPTERLENTTRHSMVRYGVGENSQWSQELRLASYLPGKFNYTIGAFYLDYDSSIQVDFYVPELGMLSGILGLPPELEPFSFQTPEFETTSWAIFGESYYDFTDDLKLTVGLRYTEEEKEIETRQISPITFVTGGSTEFNLGDGAWEEFTGKIGLSYAPDLEATDDSLFFATLSRGYKGGGINPGASETSFPTFDPEYINALELGTKNTLLDRTFQANATAFFYKYDGLQVGGILADSTTFNTNVDAEVKGAEFEFVSAPVDGLRINFNLSFLDTEIVEDFFTSPDVAFSASRGPVNLKGKELQYAPSKSAQFGIQYTHDVNNDWEVTYRLQSYWQDEYWARLYNIPTDRLDSWQQTDMSVSLRDKNNVWEVEAFVKNVDDEASITALSVEGSFIGRFRKPKYLEPRVIGIRVHYRFE